MRLSMRRAGRNARTAAAAAALTCGFAGCAARATPVPVLGEPSQVSALAGTWEGDYTGESGRSGTIAFTLQAGRDTAFGDVLMVPKPLQTPVAPNIEAVSRKPAQLIRISFVAVENGRVRGVLAPYRDPACGCRVETTFDGRLEDDVIEGTFRTRHVETGKVDEGHWRVTRKRN